MESNTNKMDINKAFGYMDTVTFREGDKKDIEYYVIGYEKDGRVNIENRDSELTINQKRLKLVKMEYFFKKMILLNYQTIQNILILLNRIIFQIQIIFQ